MDSGEEKVVKCVSGEYSQIIITVLCSAVYWVSGTTEVVAGFLPGQGRNLHLCGNKPHLCQWGPTRGCNGNL